MLSAIADYLIYVLVPLHHANRDAGIKMVDQKAMRDYVEAWFMKKGLI